MYKLILFGGCFFILIATYGNEKPRFISNYGQFKENIVFKLEHRAGNIYFEKNKVKGEIVLLIDKIPKKKNGRI